MNVTAKADYAIRAMVELASAEGGSVRTEQVAEAQGIPLGFLRSIMADLRRGDLVRGQQGVAGGFRLVRDPSEVTLGDVVRCVEGPLAQVRGDPPDQLEYPDSSASVRTVWVAVRASLRAVLDHTTVADVATGDLPAVVLELTADPAAWELVERR